MTRAKPETALILLFVLIGSLVVATIRADEGPETSFGKRPTDKQIDAWNITVFPDGRNLPAGGGEATVGKLLYAQRCAFCHGLTLNATRLKIDPDKTRTESYATNGAPALLDQPDPSPVQPAIQKTVQSYWPYATTLFDYIRRSMPFYEPGHLTDDEVYALCAFILAEAGIIPGDLEMNAKTLPAVRMPNRDGFVPSREAQSP